MVGVRCPQAVLSDVDDTLVENSVISACLLGAVRGPGGVVSCEVAGPGPRARRFSGSASNDDSDIGQEARGTGGMLALRWNVLSGS
jgi:hypothetical protein